ncbi:hypothetical protein EHF33_09685 [Deinococcus psychrotolerans]|uniref:Uncharacterized protein n=1 Tax=Deinococcus psychrotolerans TaxID=2489213 RepID=A0A3G8YFM2_9DEIO|nr:hypothetical protein [Deinococcus psychrotolerans]AZI42977.1 hypothetical protein EHF33_09685 [Deinococcus psychrotolerans]
MPNEKDLSIDLNTLAAVPRPADEEQPAEQGPAPSQLPPAPHLQPIHPHEHLDAEQVEHLMGDEDAEQGAERTEAEAP